jgi:hypothetical protein
MTDEEIIRGNEIIMKFSGWKRYYPGTAARNNRGLAQFKHPVIKGGLAYGTSDGVGKDIFPAFDKDWNLLMNVVEKIKKIDSTIDRETSLLIDNQNFLIFQLRVTSPRETVWEAVLEFAEWYTAWEKQIK